MKHLPHRFFPSAFILTAALSADLAVHRFAAAAPRVTLNDFYRPFSITEITPENMQSWPYYKHASMNWKDHALFGVETVSRGQNAAPLKMSANSFDIEQDFRGGRSFAESLTATQTKGFIILKDNLILGEFYDNGFTQDQLQLLQSASKTYAGVIVSQLIDAGRIDPDASVASYLDDFQNSAIGRATVQHVLDMQSGLLPATDYHIPGGEAFLFEIEQGLKPGRPIGHRKAVIQAGTTNPPGEVYTYNDKNTDLLAMLAEGVTGRSFAQLLSDLFASFGAGRDGSISLSSDRTASPAYGINSTLRDFALFHQWIAEGQAPRSFYTSVKDTKKDLFSRSDAGRSLAKALGTPVVYGAQAWYFPERNIIYSAGSYGQYGFSDLETGATVAFMQDWEDNAVGDKMVDMVERAMLVLNQIRLKN